MIWDSWPWKVDLAQRTSRLERRMRQKRWPESSLVKMEQDIFFAAYVIRKLFEADKLSDDLESMRLDVTVYYSTGKFADLLNWHHIEKLYDLETPEKGKHLSLAGFCNQIIHSFVFVPYFDDEGGLSGFFFASDRAKEELVHYMEMEVLVEALNAVCEDDVVASVRIRDASGQWKSVRKLSPSTASLANLPVKLSSKAQEGLRQYIAKLNCQGSAGSKS